MRRLARVGVAALLLGVGVWSCGDDGGGDRVAGPDLPEGPGRVYPLRSVSFPSADQVQVSGLLGQPTASQSPRPVVVLVHDFFSDKSEWLFMFERFLQHGYLPLAIDLRGHGDTPFPEDGRSGPFLVVEDVENSYLDVHAALTWLRGQPAVDANRVAVVGNGGGANVAFVSIGAFPQEIKTAVALSPGIWDRDQQPIGIGARLEPFVPQSILFLVGADDAVVTQDGSELSYARFASDLAAATTDPKRLTVFQATTRHGLELLDSPEAVDLLLTWLDSHL